MNTDPLGWRWGADDELGAYNLIDSAATLRGVAQVRQGKAISLALPIIGGSRGPATPTRPPIQHFMTRSGGDYCCGLKEGAGFGFSDDVVMLATHGTTHIDALAHIWRDGHMYNGFAATEVSGRGAARCGIDKLPPIVTRALFANCAAPDGARVLGPIHIDELLAAIELGGVAPLPGDALLVRTGWMTLFKAGQANTECTAGLHADCADWIISSGFVLVAADNVAVEVIPSGDPTCAVPLHVRLIRDHGVYLSELLDLDTLAEEQRAACMLMLAPLPIRGGVGSPVNPVAVF